MLTNRANLPLPIAIWLATDEYDYDPDPHVISATTLLKPIKSLVLGKRVEELDANKDSDMMDNVASRMGTAIHSAIERAWDHNLTEALTSMGIPAKAQALIDINPPIDKIDPEKHTVHIEKRVRRQLGKFTVTGQFDFCENGRVKDIKTTGTYNWIHGGNDKKYALQGSIYRWLNPELITDDVMDVVYIFTDWKTLDARTKKEYPAHRIMVRSLPLLSIAETERYLRNKLEEYEKYLDKPESAIPRCTPAELWQKPSKWAYKKNPDAVKAFRVYNSEQEAYNKKAECGNEGIIEHRPGQVKFCTYCPGRSICQQAEQYVQQKLLEI